MIPGFIKKKRCPRCSGNIYLDSDRLGWYEQCLQCGYTRYMDTVIEAREKVGEEKAIKALDDFELSLMLRGKREPEVIALEGKHK